MVDIIINRHTKHRQNCFHQTCQEWIPKADCWWKRWSFSRSGMYMLDADPFDYSEKSPAALRTRDWLVTNLTKLIRVLGSCLCFLDTKQQHPADSLPVDLCCGGAWLWLVLLSTIFCTLHCQLTPQALPHSGFIWLPAKNITKVFLWVTFFSLLSAFNSTHFGRDQLFPQMLLCSLNLLYFINTQIFFARQVGLSKNCRFCSKKVLMNFVHQKVMS